MCAALQREGYVDACATRDSDALIFGATCVYHTINLQVSRKLVDDQCCILSIIILDMENGILISWLDAVGHKKVSV